MANLWRNIRAWFYAAVAICRIETCYYCSRRILFGAWSVLSYYLGFGKRATPEVREARLRACSRCGIFDQELRTCGNAKRPEYMSDIEAGDDAIEETFGCMCQMDIKAAMEDSWCWANAAEIQNIKGWSENLNGAPK